MPCEQIKMVSEYNEFVRAFAKKCRKQGKKFELAHAAKAWRGIKGGDWRSFFGVKSKSPFYTSSSFTPEMNSRLAEQNRMSEQKRVQDAAILRQQSTMAQANDRFSAYRRKQAQQPRKPDIIHKPMVSAMTYPFYDANTKTTYYAPEKQNASPFYDARTKTTTYYH